MSNVTDIAPARELRELCSTLLDCIVLDHAMTREDWIKLLVRTGRFCEPFERVDPNKIFLSEVSK